VVKKTQLKKIVGDLMRKERNGRGSMRDKMMGIGGIHSNNIWKADDESSVLDID
jgi:hypothetical protein